LTRLELSFRRFWSQFFTFCGRSSVWLTPDVQQSLLPGNEIYRTMGFQLNGGSNVNAVAGGKPSRQASVAFLLRTNQMWEGGPGLFAAFAMDADGTAAWSWHLLNRMRDMTKRRGFFMFSFEPPEKREFRGRYDAIAAEWKAELVLEHEFANE
jgi:hypothetical protein